MTVSQMSVIFPVFSVTRVRKRWVMYTHMSVTVLTKGWVIVFQLLPIEHRCQPSHYNHNFCKSIWWCTGQSILQIDHQFSDWSVHHITVISHRIDWGVHQCTWFVNEFLDNDWPCAVVVGCIIQLRSTLLPCLPSRKTLVTTCNIENTDIFEAENVFENACAPAWAET